MSTPPPFISSAPPPLCTSHPPPSHPPHSPTQQKTIKIYVGNLPYDLSVPACETLVSSALAAGGVPHLGIEVPTFQLGEKRSKRDADRLHKGFAWATVPLDETADAIVTAAAGAAAAAAAPLFDTEAAVLEALGRVQVPEAALR
jgi:hypothetical protein